MGDAFAYGVAARDGSLDIADSAVVVRGTEEARGLIITDTNAEIHGSLIHVEARNSHAGTAVEVDGAPSFSTRLRENSIVMAGGGRAGTAVRVNPATSVSITASLFSGWAVALERRPTALRWQDRDDRFDVARLNSSGWGSNNRDGRFTAAVELRPEAPVNDADISEFLERVLP